MGLEIREIVRGFGHGKRRVLANDGVSLDIPSGQVLGLLGHNGAGKTTLVRQIVGLLRPNQGEIRLEGHDLVADPVLARQMVSVQAQGTVPISGLAPRKAIELVGRMRGGERAAVRRRADHLIEALAMEEWADRVAENLSGGIARLTAFAMALVVPGSLIALDEPTNDVDPVRRRLLWRQVRAVADEGAAVLLVTHNVREAVAAVDALTILDHGRVVASGTPAELMPQSGTLEDLYVALTESSQEKMA